ncbi:hypothetical protein BKA63DRAFT_591084 [Paraphoma chrysanthemicola]|nr:hypothetical protein BKA63DRAFT_591084 [Paraphoma chrysanthemicola]
MRSTALAAVILPVALAQWNTEICNGVGGCMSYGGPANFHPWNCPDGSRITLPDFSNDLRPAGYPGATVVSKEDFPTTCYDPREVPGPNDRLVSVPTRNGQTAYAYLVEGCTHPNPAPQEINNCYTYSVNESVYRFCQLIDASGQQCEKNPNAGRCERWGGSSIREECIGWEPGMPDFPDRNP